MTDKRFYIYDEHIVDKEGVIDSFWIETYSQAKEICDLLNKLNEENKGLKSSNMEMEDYCARLEEKNEELRKQIDELIKGIQDGASESADAICKPLLNKGWGKGE